MRGIFRGVLTQKNQVRNESSVLGKFHALKTYSLSSFTVSLRRMLKMPYCPLTKKEKLVKGPFLVSTKPPQTLYEKYATKFREPTKDFLSIMNVGKLLFGLLFTWKVADAKKDIEQSNIYAKAINKKMDDLVEDLPNVCEKLEESNIELKKLNDAVLNFHKAMINNREMEEGKRESRTNDRTDYYILKVDNSVVYINKKLIEAWRQ